MGTGWQRFITSSGSQWFSDYSYRGLHSLLGHRKPECRSRPRSSICHYLHHAADWRSCPWKRSWELLKKRFCLITGPGRAGADAPLLPKEPSYSSHRSVLPVLQSQRAEVRQIVARMFIEHSCTEGLTATRARPVTWSFGRKPATGGIFVASSCQDLSSQTADWLQLSPKEGLNKSRLWTQHIIVI